MEGLGQGIATLGFWLMIAAAIVAGVWLPARVTRDKSKADIEAARLAIESGQSADQALKNLMRGDMQPHRKLKIGGVVVLGVAAGLAAFGWFIGAGAPEWAMPMYGIGALVACIGASLLLAGLFAGPEKNGG